MKKVFIFLTLLSFLSIISCRKTKITEARSEICLGTICSVNLFEDGTVDLYSEIFSELDRIELKFSLNIQNSELSSINMHQKEEIEVSSDVRYVLQLALKIAELSEGAFNPAIGKLVKLWGINSENPKVPSQEEIHEALKNIDWKKIHLNQKLFLEDSVEIDLGGIAKGFACDRIVEILKNHSVKKAIIDLGGNIFVFGKKSDDRKWLVGIKNPFEPENEPILGIEVENCSVVTSGTYERFFEEKGRRYHHILDSKTGFPVENGLESVTVISESSILADALSTALFSLGTEKGLELLKKLDCQAEAIFIEKNGKITSTENVSVFK